MTAAAWMNPDDRTECAKNCRALLLQITADLGVEVNVSTTPPPFQSPYEPLNMVCPHGQMWYAEPTTDQIAAWVEAGTP